jgi:hypothetical protein
MNSKIIGAARDPNRRHARDQSGARTRYYALFIIMYAGRAVVGMPDHRLVGECENLALVVRYSRNGRWRQKYIESPKNIL